MPSLRTVVGVVLLVAIGLISLAVFAYALWKWWRVAQRLELPVWRRIASFAGFVTVIVQGATFVAFWCWPQISRDNKLLGAWARWAFASFIIAVPFVLAGKGASRWWLLSSSVLLFVICFLLSTIA
jgi:hypothetical protein